MSKLIAILGALAAASPALAADPAPVIAADRAMASISASKGVHAALRAYLAPDAAVVSGGEVTSGPVEKLLATYPEGKLRWTPLGGAMSEDATLGVTWGTWTTDLPNGGHVDGAYNTAWRKTGGQWRVILDGGSPKVPPR